MLEKIRVSWVAPVFNKVAYIAQTIESIQAQDFKDMEIIFVNDGSTDGTEDVIQHYQKTDKRIKLINLGENKGLGFAWDIGTKAAMGSVIVVGSGDDIWEPNRTKLSYKALKDGKKDVFYGAFYFCDGLMSKIELKPTIKYNKKKLLEPRKDGFCPQYIGHFVMAYTRKIALKVPYRADLKVGIDYPFLVDLAKANARFCWTKEILGYARLLKSGVSISRRSEVVAASKV